MTALPPQVVNDFATGVTTLFARAAKGLDEHSERFIARRPYERILTGFLTPVEVPDGEQPPPAEADLSPDESYEQTNLGFEWCAPLNAITEGSRVTIRIGLNVYVRMLP